MFQRERQSYPEIGKRGGKPDFEYPPWLKMDLARWLKKRTLNESFESICPLSELGKEDFPDFQFLIHGRK